MNQRDETNPMSELPAPEPPPASPRESVPIAMPQVLRALGAVLLVIAASSFMFRDWGQRDDVVRYLMLLGQLGLLAGAGFFCGLKLNEKRGARTFLSLVLAVIPVHFAVLGGVLYSQLALDAPSSHLAAHAIWRAQDAATAVGLILGAQLVIVPATFVAMMTLARRHAARLTVALLGICAISLLPLREPDSMALVVLIVSPLIAFLQLRVFSGGAALSTPHGRFARVMLVVPLLLVIGRTFLYYDVTPLFFGVSLGSVALLSFAHDARADAGRGRYRFALPQVLALAAMCLGWVAVWGDLVLQDQLFRDFAVLSWPLLGLPIAAIASAASGYLARGGHAIRCLAGLLAMLTVTLNLLAFDEIAAGLLSLAVGVGLGVFGARVRRKALVVMGAVAVVAGLVSVGVLTIRIDALTHWGSLTAIGVALIFGAAALDRNRQRLLRRFALLRGRMSGWSY